MVLCTNQNFQFLQCYQVGHCMQILQAHEQKSSRVRSVFLFSYSYRCEICEIEKIKFVFGIYPLDYINNMQWFSKLLQYSKLTFDAADCSLTKDKNLRYGTVNVIYRSLSDCNCKWQRKQMSTAAQRVVYVVSVRCSITLLVFR